MNREFMAEAIRLSIKRLNEDTGGPFGAVIVREGEIIGRGWNQVTASNDPTAHAEMVAIREACRRLGHFHLTGCELYSSCEPCPMCLAAAYWARLDRVFFAMFQYVAHVQEKGWQPGPYEGVELLVLHKNETTGGVTVVPKFRAGLTVPAHTHPLAQLLAANASSRCRSRRERSLAMFNNRMQYCSGLALDR